MTKPTLLVAATAIALAPFLAGCGASSGSSGAAPTSAAAATPAASGAQPASTAPSTTAPAATPTSDPAQEKDDVEAATEKFTKVAFTIGYPDKSFDVYLNRLEPLMTDKAFADAKKSYKDRPKLDKSFAGFSERHQRASVALLSPVKVTTVSGDKATAEVSYRFLTQQQDGDRWKTLKTGEKDSAKFPLVLQDGKWLVDKF